jgi:hypothetical protein
VVGYTIHYLLILRNKYIFKAKSRVFVETLFFLTFLIVSSLITMLFAIIKNLLLNS